MSEQRVDLAVGLPAVGAALCILAAVLALGACRSAAETERAALPSVPPTDSAATAEPPAVQLLRSRAWSDAGEAALARPTPVDLPHEEWGGFRAQEPNARGIAFTASAGQILEVNLARAETDAPDAIDVEVFLLDTRGERAREVRLAELPSGESTLRFRLPLEATYVVRLQPAPLTDAMYAVRLELGAVLPSPLRGYEIKSFFGDRRDQGRRHHEGIDMYAPRRTPVVAVADGQATYRENRLGGHTVWLATSKGISYYYAHLERVAVGSGQRVRTGDVLGYVGDSGNAVEVGPHLHFGVYHWGTGAVDPLPMLEAREFEKSPAGSAPPSTRAAIDTRQLATAGCVGRPPQSLTPFKRCTTAELLKQRPYSVTDGTCPEIAPPCLRMADEAEIATVPASGRVELALASPKPFSVELAAAAVLDLGG
ncbi:MAG TPA: M23 family metallopeptidase, partial [Gammaproteobacteria bacterium]|nr:M23 family metallopeptidase [Gammaproteobacteria bacterium]